MKTISFVAHRRRSRPDEVDSRTYQPVRPATGPPESADGHAGGPNEDTVLRLDVPSDVLVLERLLVTAGPHHRDLASLAELVNRSRGDLRGSPPQAMPELLERLVRQRLAVPEAE